MSTELEQLETQLQQADRDLRDAQYWINHFAEPNTGGRAWQRYNLHEEGELTGDRWLDAQAEPTGVPAVKRCTRDASDYELEYASADLELQKCRYRRNELRKKIRALKAAKHA